MFNVSGKMLGQPKSKASTPWPRHLRRAAAHLLASLMTPIVHCWIRRQETHICRQGRPLDGAALNFARRIGVAEPHRVRVLTVAHIPLPAQRLAKAVARFSHVMLADPVALTAGQGIYVQKGIEDDPMVLRHELVHVRQYQQIGRKRFLRRYILECLIEGYNCAPLEKEARRLSVPAADD